MQELPDDIFDKNGILSGPAIHRLRKWYNTGQTAGNTEPKSLRELKREIRGAIEGVTNICPEHIIIDTDRNDT